jgi:DNA-binding MarR family transcriptional regulator
MVGLDWIIRSCRIVHVTQMIDPTTTPGEARGEPPSTSPDGAPDGIVDAILTELGGTIRELRCASTERLVRTGVSMGHVHVLWLLEHHGAMPMSRLADLLDVSVSNATGLIDRMEERGFVERVRVPDDRRLVLVRPAAGGREALAENDDLKRDRMRAALRRLDRPQLERALSTFRDLRQAVQAELGTAGPHRHHFIDSAD